MTPRNRTIVHSERVDPSQSALFTRHDSSPNWYTPNGLRIPEKDAEAFKQFAEKKMLKGMVEDQPQSTPTKPPPASRF
jgi:hypothetical protein